MEKADYIAIIWKTVFAVILGGLIGLERQNKHRPAGFRTHILVCLGSMTVMILSELLFKKYYNEFGITSDPARLGAQVISGIGFLGAGTIIHYGTNVKGLTTAASLWAVAAIGLTIGAGFYFLAIVVVAAILIILLVFNVISRKVNDAGNILEIVIELINKQKALGAINQVFAKHNLKILDMEYDKPSDSPILEESSSTIISLRVVLQIPPGFLNFEFLKELEAINGVTRVERI